VIYEGALDDIDPAIIAVAVILILFALAALLTSLFIRKRP
jgi:hypothetical protein